MTTVTLKMSTLISHHVTHENWGIDRVAPCAFAASRGFFVLGEGAQSATDGGDLPLWHHHGEGFEVGGGHRALDRAAWIRGDLGSS